MKTPDKIYVREYPDGIAHFWESKKKEDVAATIPHEYIRKEALLEWAKEQLDILNKQTLLHPDDEVFWGQRNAFKQLFDKLNSM